MKAVEAGALEKRQDLMTDCLVWVLAREQSRTIEVFGLQLGRSCCHFMRRGMQSYSG